MGASTLVTPYGVCARRGGRSLRRHCPDQVRRSADRLRPLSPSTTSSRACMVPPGSRRLWRQSRQTRKMPARPAFGFTYALQTDFGWKVWVRGGGLVWKGVDLKGNGHGREQTEDGATRGGHV